MDPCTRCNGSGTEPPLPAWERRLLEDQQRAQFLVTYQHMLINGLEIAAAFTEDQVLREQYTATAAEMKKLPCLQCW